MATPRNPISQQEIDALMAGGFGAGDAPGDSSAPPDEVRPFDIGALDQLVHGPMHGMDIINQRFARNFQTALFDLIQRPPEIAVGNVGAQKYSTFLNELNPAAHCSLMTLPPLLGLGLIVCEPALVFAMIDAMYGGTGQYQPMFESIAHSGIAQRGIDRMLTLLVYEYAQAWRGVFPLEPALADVNVQTRFANIATPSDAVISSSFHIEIGETTAAIHICLPQASLAPIRELLHSNTQGDFIEPDTRWGRMLTQSVQSVELTMAAHVVPFELTVAQVLALKVGDFVALKTAPYIEAAVEGMPVFECQYRTHEDKFALKIVRSSRGSALEELGAARE